METSPECSATTPTLGAFACGGPDAAPDGWPHEASMAARAASVTGRTHPAVIGFDIDSSIYKTVLVSLF
jgi:hypothetical protein